MHCGPKHSGHRTADDHARCLGTALCQLLPSHRHILLTTHTYVVFSYVYTHMLHITHTAPNTVNIFSRPTPMREYAGRALHALDIAPPRTQQYYFTRPNEV